jgi:hypothetical protein
VAHDVANAIPRLQVAGLGA